MSSERTRAWEGGGSERTLNFDRDFDREVEGGPSPLRILTEILTEGGPRGGQNLTILRSKILTI